MSLPCADVVSAHVSASERKPALALAMASRVFNRSRVLARQPVEAGHDQHVALIQRGNRLGERLPVGLRA